MTILYKILGIIINTVAMLLSVSLLASLPMMISSPLTMLSAFMMVSIVLYAWFSHQFNKKVLQQQQVVKKSLKDWVKVNGIVALVFSVVVIIDVFLLIRNPQAYVDAIKSYGIEMSLQTITTFLYVMLTYGIVLLVHVVWNFFLLKKNSSFFQ